MTTQTAPLGEAAAFNHFLPRAQALAPTAVRKRGDAQLALNNVLTGLDALDVVAPQLAARWPADRITAMQEARSLALAAAFASSQALLLDVRQKGLGELGAAMYQNRAQLFAVLDAAAAFSLLPAERVAKLRSGTGPIDGGQDLIDGVALVREFATALENKTPFTPAWLHAADSLGNRVVQEFKATGAREDVNVAAKAAADVANRMWTLLVDAHAEIRKAGFEMWGDAMNDHVPLLQSRTGLKRAAPAPQPPEA